MRDIVIIKLPYSALEPDRIVSFECPFWELLPALSDDEASELRNSIEDHGIKTPLVVLTLGLDRWLIVDGYHRATQAEGLGLYADDLPINQIGEEDDFEPEELEALAVELNLRRRHMTPEQRVEWVAKLRAKGKSLREIADQIGVGVATVHRDLKSGVPLGTPDTVTGRDGKEYQAKAPPKKEEPKKEEASVEATRPEDHDASAELYGSPYNQGRLSISTPIESSQRVSTLFNEAEKKVEANVSTSSQSVPGSGVSVHAQRTGPDAESSGAPNLHSALGRDHGAVSGDQAMVASSPQREGASRSDHHRAGGEEGQGNQGAASITYVDYNTGEPAKKKEAPATHRARCHFCVLLNDCTMLGKKHICAECRTKELRGRCDKCRTTKDDNRVFGDELICGFCQKIKWDDSEEESDVASSVESSMQKSGELDSKTLLPKRSPEAKQAYKEQTDANREAKHAAIAGEARSLASPGKLGPFSLIYADCPWQYDAKISDAKAIEQQYPTLSTEELCKLPISSITAPKAVLYFWATAPLIEDALAVIKAWGFTYKSHYVWIKGKNGAGMGHWVRADHELLFIATKGSFPTPLTDDRRSSVLEFERGRHSEKPSEVRELLEKLYTDQPKVELFAREKAEGWVSIGNEIDGRDIRDVLRDDRQGLLPVVATPEAKPLPKEEITEPLMLHQALKETAKTYQQKGYDVSILTGGLLHHQGYSVMGYLNHHADRTSFRDVAIVDPHKKEHTVDFREVLPDGDTIGEIICTLSARYQEQEFPSPWMVRGLKAINESLTREEADKVAKPLLEKASTDEEKAKLTEALELTRARLPHAENVRSPRKEEVKKETPKEEDTLYVLEAWLKEGAVCNRKGGYALFHDEVRQVTLTPKALANWQKDDRIKLRTEDWFEEGQAELKACTEIAEAWKINDRLIDLTVTKEELEKVKANFIEWRKSRAASTQGEPAKKAPKPKRLKGKNEEKKAPAAKKTPAAKKQGGRK